MGNCIEQWRVSIGRWSGGRLSNCVKLQKYIDQTSNNTSYMKIRYLLLLSLLVIGCVELNPGPDHQPPATSKIDAAYLKFSRRPGTDRLHGISYERKMAAFLFARALHKTAEFRLASNVDGICVFDDLVFRYRLKGSDVWKTCFIQLKHKEKEDTTNSKEKVGANKVKEKEVANKNNENEGTIPFSSLIKMSGDFSLFKYFASYCHIKRHASTEKNLVHWGPFDDFQFVIYTNAKMEINSALQAEDSDPLVILSSDTNCGQYITFYEAVDTKVYNFFEELSECRDLLVELNNQIAGGTFVGTEIGRRIESFTNTSIKGELQSLKLNFNKDSVTGLISELEKCDFTLYKEFLSKVKIFHSQSNEKSLKGLIENELNNTCKTSPSLSKSIYTKFEEGFSKWWEQAEDVDWLSKNAELWQDVVTHIFTEISEPNLNKFVPCCIRFSDQQIQRLCDAIKHNTYLNIVTNCDIRYLQHLKTYQALNKLGYSNSLCIGLKSLMKLPKEILKLWHSKWSAALIIDCDCDGNMADILLGILQQSVGCEQELDISDANMVETLAAVLQKYEQKVILISTRQHIRLASHFQKQLGNINGAYDGDCALSDFDEESQRQILENTVDFQGIDVTLGTLVGTNRLKCIKPFVDCDVISILLSNDHKLCVGRQLSDDGKPDGKPRFRHRCFTEYFAAKWLTDNFTKCKDFISDYLFKSTYEVTRNIFDRMLAKDFEIHGAVLNNDISNVEKILKNGTDINKTDKGGRTALHLAASCNSPAIQKLLSYPGISTNIPDKVLKWTPLTYADRTKSWMAMDILLQKGANLDHIVLNRPNSENQECEKEAMFECASKGYRVLMDFMFNCGNEINAVLEIPEHFQSKISLLHIASIYCQVDIIRLLVERGADVNIRDNENDTALHSAAFSGSVEIINILLEKGMCVNLRGQSERTPLHCSALGGNLETTKTLVEKGAALNDVSKNGYTPLLLAAEEGKLDVFLYLTERGADINMRNVHSDSALHSAANSGSVEIINILLDKGMCVNLTGQINWTPLHRSARRGNSEATKTLVERGAAINDVARDGSTPLLLAAEQGKLDVFHYLTERGADINIRNVNSNNALHSAAYSGSVEIINILLDKGMCVNLTGQYNWTPLHCSAIGGTFEATKTLVERGAALNCVTKDGSTPLDLAAEKGKLDVFHYLTEKGADINIRTVHSNTVLHTAAYSGSVEIINILLDRGMCVNVTGYNNWTPLHCSVRFGKLEATKTLVKRGAVLNVVEKYGGTPLFIAAEEGQLEIFHYLTERGADINIRNVYSKNALHSAAYSGSVEIINILLDRGMCVNVPGQNNWTPLHFSARRGNLEATKILVERGSALNDVSKNGGTALYLAAEEGKLEVFLYLTERGADINIRNDQGNNALHTAANSGSVEIINILLDKGMCVNLTGQYNWTPLHCSATGGNLEATKILVERGAALNDVTKDGSTPLLLAAEKGKCNVFHYLTERGADINIRNVHSNNALHSAANSGSVEIINILLDKGMCVNLTGHNNWTPLHHTAIGGNLEATKILVERGAALNNVDKCGNTPLLLAAKEGKLEVFHYLIERGADINIRNVHADNALHSAANSGSVEIINIFLDKGMCVNLTGQNNWTPLHHSARRGNFEATKTLVERGAALNDVDKDGYTPLLLAAKEGKLEVFHYLTERGADINIRNVHSDNALHSAANSGSVEIINILLDKGMCVNLTGQNNWTPLHLSAIGGNLEATKILVERGAALNDVDKDGYTPLLLAAKEGKLDVFHYLTERGADINIRNVYSNNALHSASNSDSVVFCGQCHESHGIL